MCKPCNGDVVSTWRVEFASRKKNGSPQNKSIRSQRKPELKFRRHASQHYKIKAARTEERLARILPSFRHCCSWLSLWPCRWGNGSLQLSGFWRSHFHRSPSSFRQPSSPRTTCHSWRPFCALRHASGKTRRSLHPNWTTMKRKTMMMKKKKKKTTTTLLRGRVCTRKQPQRHERPPLWKFAGCPKLPTQNPPHSVIPSQHVRCQGWSGEQAWGVG